MSVDDRQLIEGALCKAEGVPKKSNPEELSRWQQFKYWVFPHLKKNAELAQEYACAEVTQKKADAQVCIEEAARIAAEREKTEAETDLINQQATEQFNKNIDSIFKDDSLPDAAKQIKLAGLFSKNPEIADQLNQVNYIIEKLELTKHTRIKVTNEHENPTEEIQKSQPRQLSPEE